MKDLKDFLLEVVDLSPTLKPLNTEDLELVVMEMARIVSEAYVAGMNFQASQVKKPSA